MRYYDCRAILKHVLNRYNIFRVVNFFRTDVVGSIYTTRYVVKGKTQIV